MRRALVLAVLVCATLPARAAESDGEGAPAEAPKERQGLVLEGGLFLGGFFPSDNHELYDPVTDEGTLTPHQPLSPGLDLGLRAAVLPIPWVGLEGELALVPTSAEDGGAATLTSGRLHVIGQVPGLGHEKLTPFALAGASRWGIASDPEVLGTDADGTFHLGAGAKFDITHWLLARLEYRHTRADGHDVAGTDGGVAGHHEFLAGVSYQWGKKPPPPPDPDKDGFAGEADKCPMEKGIAPDGCPDPDPDRDNILGKADRCPMDPGIPPDGCPDPDPDKDKVLLGADKCPDVAGIPPDGCPDPDPDKDGVNEPDDKCPDVAGIPPDGCPDPDPDKDGVPLPQDKCPTELETMNGYMDLDGCPDEIPKEVKKFTGVIPGINFAWKSAKIEKSSFKTLDAAVKVLQEFPELQLEISGHTDSEGEREFNLKLSADRAAAVKDYMVGKGVAENRIVTRGAGPDEPVADNKTKAGRAKNRRTEFKPISR